jgi:3',5'-cyclic-AMP phosphodiesterase
VKGASASIVDLGGPASPMFDVIHAREPEAGMQAYLVNAVSGEVSRTRTLRWASRPL